MSFCRCLVAISLLATWVLAKDPPKKSAAPAGGVKTPGVLIPFANLKSEADLTLASPPVGFVFDEAVSVADSTGLRRFDAKTNQPFEPSRDVKEIGKPCGGVASGLSYLWLPTCDKVALAKLEAPAPARGGRGRRPDGPKPDAAKPDETKPNAAKSNETKQNETKPEAAAKPEPPKPALPKPDFAKTKPPAPPAFIALETAPLARQAVAVSEDSVWLLADGKTSLQRIDPQQNAVVADIRLPASCAAILFAENAVWVACPTETKVLRIDPRTNLVDKRIEVAAQPVALAAGEGAIWVLGKKEGKISRVDPKTNKVTATVELGIANVDGTLAFGDGYLWASAPGFPVMRIAPATDKVVQQFHGEGGGIVAFGAGSVWVGSEKSSVLRRFDPKRIQATLAE
jgi:hypothetical protein